MNWDGLEWWPIAIRNPNFVTEELVRRGVGGERSSGEQVSYPIFESRTSLLSLHKLDVMKVLLPVVFCVTTPHGLLCGYQRMHLQGRTEDA